MTPVLTTLLDAAENVTDVITSTIQRDSVISFPMFGENFSINPPAYFTIFGKNIYFYGVFIALGFILGILYISKRAKLFGIQEDDVYDLVIWLIPISIIGARLYYVAFQWDYYAAHPSEIIAIWEGGLAIYGGEIAGFLTVFFVARHKKIPFFAFTDMVVYALFIGQIIGRWGNFMNREAFGAVTDIFCRMGLTDVYGNTIYVHPTFLYESLWNLIGFCFLVYWLKSGRRSYDGQTSLFYFFWYGLGRSWIEGLRTDSLYIAGTDIRVSQLLSVIICLASLLTLIMASRRKHDPSKLFVNRVRAAEAVVSVETAPSENSASAEESTAEPATAAEEAPAESSPEAEANTEQK